MQLQQRVAELGRYHTLELAPGVVADGMFDLRPWVDRDGHPERLDALRVLEIGTWDGSCLSPGCPSWLPFAAGRYHADREAAVVSWMSNRRTWRKMIYTAGFDAVREHAYFKMPSRRGFDARHASTTRPRACSPESRSPPGGG